MLSKCLSRYQSTPLLHDPVIGAMNTIRSNLKRQFSVMICEKELHVNMNIVGVCCETECHQYRRIVCVKCMITPSHNEHATNIVLIQDALNEKSHLNKLLTLLTNHQLGRVEDSDGQIEWLYNVIIFGKVADYPNSQFDDLLSTFQKEIYDNLLDIRQQFENEVNQTNKTTTSMFFQRPAELHTQKQKLFEFRKSVNAIIKENNLKIKNKFNQIFIEDGSTSLVEPKTTPPSNESNSHRQLNFLSLLQEFPSQQSDPKPEDMISNKSTTQLPCFSFIQEKSPRKASFTLFGSKKSVSFKEGGKLINLISNSRIVSNMAFHSGNVEMRFKVLSEIKSCLHVGIIDQELQNVQEPFETAGVWCCLHPCHCTQNPNMIISTYFETLSVQSVIGLNLDFENDEILVKHYTHQSVITLYKSQGLLKQQKQLFFINSSEAMTLELKN